MSSKGRINVGISTDESTCGETSDCETDLNQAIYDPSSTGTLESLFPSVSTCNYRQPHNDTSLDSITSRENSNSAQSYTLTSENLEENTDRFEPQQYNTDFDLAIEKLTSLKLRKSPDHNQDTVSTSKQTSANTSKSTSTILAGNMVEAPGVYRTANSWVNSMSSTIVAGRLLSSDSIGGNDEMNDLIESPTELSNSLFNEAIEEIEGNETEIFVVDLDSEDYTDSLEKYPAKTVDISKKKNTPLARCKTTDTIVLSSDDEFQVVFANTDNQMRENKSNPNSKILSKQKDKDSLNMDTKSTVDSPTELLDSADGIDLMLLGSENAENLDPQLGTARNKGDRNKPAITSVETVLFPIKIIPASMRKLVTETLCQKERDSNFNISSEQSCSNITNPYNIDTTCSETEMMIYANIKTPSLKVLRSINDCCMSSPKVGVIHDSISSIDLTQIPIANPATPNYRQQNMIPLGVTQTPTANSATMDSPQHSTVTMTNKSNEINQAQLWSMLSKMELSLSTPGKKPTNNSEQFINRLSDEFKAGPSNFTQRLVTIIEESVIQGNRYPEDALDVNMSRIMGDLMKSYQGIENETMPEFAPSLCMNTPSSPGIASPRNRISTTAEEKPEDASRCCCGHQTPESCSVELKTSTVTPKVCCHQSPFTITPGFQKLAGSSRIYPRTPRSIHKISSSSSENQTPGSLGSPADGRTTRHGCNDSTASFSNLEAWCKQMYSPERSTPKRRVQEESRMVNSRPSKLAELMNIYERQAFMNDSILKESEAADSEAVNSPASFVEEADGNSTNPNDSCYQVDPGDGSYLENLEFAKNPVNKVQVSSQGIETEDYTRVYEDELQKSLLAEVAEKRRRCFDTAKIIMEITDDPNAGILKVSESAARNDTLPETDSGFLSTLSACTEYHTYINSKRNTLQTIIEKSDKLEGGLRRAPDSGSMNNDLLQNTRTRTLASTSTLDVHSRQNIEKRNPKDHRKIGDSPSEEAIGEQFEPWFLRESGGRKANSKDSMPIQNLIAKFGTSPLKTLSTKSILRPPSNSNVKGSVASTAEKSPRLKKASIAQGSVKRRSLSPKSPLRPLRSPRSNLKKSTPGSSETKKEAFGLFSRSSKPRILSPRSPMKSPISKERNQNPGKSIPKQSPLPVQQNLKKGNTVTTTTTRSLSNVSHRRLQSRLAKALSSPLISNETNTSANLSPSSPHLCERNNYHRIPFLTVTAPTPDKKKTDEMNETSYTAFEFPGADKKDCGTPQTKVTKKKFFFTPGKSPTYGKVKRKPQYYFAPVKKTPSRELTPNAKNSQLQRVYRTCDSSRTVISPVAMYIKGANAPLVKNLTVTRNELMLTPTRKNIKAQKTPTELRSPILARSPKISEDSQINFPLPPQERCGQLEDEDGADTWKNAASTCAGVGSTAGNEFKLPRMSYKAAPRVVMLDKTAGVPQAQRMKGVLQSTAIRHAGRMKSAYPERDVTTDNSVTDSLLRDSADISVHVQVPVQKTDYISTKKAA